VVRRLLKPKSLRSSSSDRYPIALTTDTLRAPADTVSAEGVATHAYGQGNVTTLSSRITSRSLLSLMLAARTLQGFAAAMIVVFSLIRFELRPIATTSLWSSAALCGMALTAAGQRAAVTRFGHGSLFAFYNSCIAAGLFFLWKSPGAEADFAAAILIGVGITTEWAPSTDLFRRMLSSQNRWQGIRLWSLAFPLGLLFGILTVSISGDAAAAGAEAGAQAGAVLSLLCVPTWFLLASTATSSRITERHEEPPAVSPSSTATEVAHAPENVTPAAAVPPSEPADCNADECCGGTQEFQPTAFSVGVMIGTVGITAVWGSAFNVLYFAFQFGSNTAATAATAATAVPAGLAAGTWLLFSVAPRVGYVVAILPFLVLAGIMTIVCGLVSPVSPFFAASCLLCGLFAGAVACGTNAMIGELFSDCPDNGARTRVVTVSYFASAVMMLLTGVLQPLLRNAETVVMLNSLIFVVGILAVRAVPGPIVSSLGRDDPADAETDAEREDIVAAIRE
jgi:hypothetical protein